MNKTVIPHSVNMMLAILLLVVLTALHFLHLNADTPRWYSGSAGEYVDEGYKTLSARNLALYKLTHWHPEDEYRGWHEVSPIPSWLYYYSFKHFGVELSTVRGLTIVLFALMCVAFLMILRQRYSLSTLVLGLLLLSITPAMYFFTRLALLETHMIFFIYIWVFILSRIKDEMYLLPIVGTLLLAPFITWTVKPSALIYIFPMIVALGARVFVNPEFKAYSMRRLFLVSSVLILILVLFATRDIWINRLSTTPLTYLGNLFSSPLFKFAPFMFLAGWACAFHLVVSKFEYVVISSYRSVIVGLVLIGPLLLGFFSYAPPRYYVPFLPAYALVICEWYAVRCWREDIVIRGKVFLFFTIATLSFWLLSLSQVTTHFFRKVLGELSALMVLDDSATIAIALFTVIILVTTLCVKFKQYLNAKVVSFTIGFCLVLLTLHAVLRLSSFVVNPAYNAVSIRTQLDALVKPGGVIIGDWAPFLTLGTDIKTLYMSDKTNLPDRLEILRPDYFLFSDNVNGHRHREAILANSEITLGSPMLVTEYNFTEVKLYSLVYMSTPVNPK